MPSRLIPTALGALAVLTTTTTFALHIILANSLSDRPSLKSGAIISALLECSVLIVLTFLFLTQFIPRCKTVLTRWSSIFFASSMFMSLAATTSSVATLITLSNLVASQPQRRVVGSTEANFLVGSGVSLGLALASQLLFVVIFFIVDRIPGLSAAFSIHTDEESVVNRSQPMLQIPHPVKSVRYSRTTEAPTQTTRDQTSTDSRTPPGSSAGYSTSETMASIRSSLSNVVRPISSKTRLLSTRGRRSRATSLESYKERTTISNHSHESGFDSWDTSTVDAHNRQTVLDGGSPVPQRFLETIPASPTTSRSPSPGCPLEFRPPRPMARRSRSYSPATKGPRAPYMNEQPPPSPASSEAHIHPLFRSDSPTPPPMATPGTIVLAAPNAGQVISDRLSIRSLSRMRSGSLPCQPSPLSRQSSAENLGRRGRSEEPESPKQHRHLDEDSEDPHRSMTPPIPDWILSAGSRTSLVDYQSRKTEKSTSGVMSPRSPLSARADTAPL